MNELTQRGINALKANDRASARKLLAAALQQDQNDASAWLWLAAAVDTPGQRIDCLRQVLKIDPTNQAALKGMAALGVPVSEEVETPQPAEEPEAIQLPGPQTPESAPIQSAAEPLAEPTLPDASTETDATADELLARALPVPEAAAAPKPSYTPAPAASYRPPHRAEIAEEDARKIFNVRPSNVPALLAFWVFFFGSLFVGSQVNSINPGGTFQGEGPLQGLPFSIFGLIFSLALGMLLELVVLFVVIRNMRTHYELTSASLTLPFRGRRTRIPVSEIYSADCHQSFFQRLYGAGDIVLNAAVKGELMHVRMRSVPECQKRAQEIGQLIRDTAGAQPG